MEEVKETQAVEAVETNEANQTVDQNEEISNSVFAKIKDFFANKEETKEEASEQDIDKLVEERVQAKLNEIVPQLKKSKEENLQKQQEQLKQLEQQNKEKEIDEVIKEIADENYVEFLKFQANNGIDLKQFIEANPMYAKKQTPTYQTQATSSTGAELSQADSIAYQNLKKSGII